MATVEELQKQLDDLRATRAGGEKRIRWRDGETEFRTDGELAAAITDLERRIAALQGKRVGEVRLHTSKGL